MENFIVSARKYRPDSFMSVVGQAAITSTLKNAIKNNQLGHAYLFSGPRGVGKTTCARIFAKTINCKNISAGTEACNACESCTSFNERKAFNIHELDAASNNSVDDIRSLTEQVRIPPQVGKYSVYIIDEVHMLSSQAFNAFLKTLEEPPAHAVFILATTEKHKIIPTILSRCQIYDFNRIRTMDAVDYLKYIAGEEGISFEEDALHVIAQKADGAMRDALSIFDQVVSFSEGKISYAGVIENLNILDLDYYFRLTDYFLAGNIPGALLTFNEILEKGFDARNFINGLASHFRDLLVTKDSSTLVLLDAGDSIKEKYASQSGAVPVEFLFGALDICTEADLQFRNSNNQRLTIELALVRIANLSEVQKKKEIDDLPDEEVVEQELPEKEIPGLKTEDHIQEHEEADDEVLPVVQEEAEESAGAQASGERTNQVIHARSISIKGALKGEGKDIPLADEDIDEDDQVITVEEKETQEVRITEADLQRAWKEYATSIEKSQPRIFSTLNQHTPRLTESGRVSIELISQAQRENFIHKIKPGLVRYLQEHLANMEYVFETNLLSNDVAGKKIYTDQDRLDFLIKKNPELEDLKNRFSLDFDT